MASEFALIDDIRKALRNRSGAVVRWIGDDAAVAEPPQGLLVTSIDSYVDGVHFRRGQIPAADIGCRALAATLSDLAAMGASADTAFVALGLPADVEEDEVLEIFAGIEKIARTTGTTVCGGDLSAAPALFLSLCANGHADAHIGAIGRNGARPGDLVGVTGTLGGARAGLALLDAASRSSKDVARLAIEHKLRHALVARYSRPQPRLTEGSALAAGGVRAMIDLSDGLASDGQRIAEASGVDITIDLERLPLDAGVAEVARAVGHEPTEFAATGGDDYELLVCVPEAGRTKTERAAGPAGITWIGNVEAARADQAPALHIFRAGEEVVGLRGYEHFATP